MQKQVLGVFSIIIDAGVSIVIMRLLIGYCGINKANGE